MKVYSIILFNEEAKILENIEDVSSFGFFEKRSIKEFFIFISKTIIERSDINKRVSILQDKYKVNCFKNQKNGIVIITDIEYQERSLFQIMYNVIKGYNEGEHNLLTENLINKLQDPRNYDKIANIQNQLDETVKVMYDSIDKVLERGEKLETLVEKSSDLSIHSKAFYRESRKMNSCCVIC